MKVSRIYSYRELFRQGCEKGCSPLATKDLPSGTKLVSGATLHPTLNQPDPLGYYDLQGHYFYDRSGTLLGRVSKPSINPSKRVLANQVTLAEDTGEDGIRKTFLVDEDQRRIAFYVAGKDAVALAVNPKKKMIAAILLPDKEDWDGSKR